MTAPWAALQRERSLPSRATLLYPPHTLLCGATVSTPLFPSRSPLSRPGNGHGGDVDLVEKEVAAEKQGRGQGAWGFVEHLLELIHYDKYIILSSNVCTTSLRFLVMYKPR